MKRLARRTLILALAPHIGFAVHSVYFAILFGPDWGSLLLWGFLTLSILATIFLRYAARRQDKLHCILTLIRATAFPPLLVLLLPAPKLHGTPCDPLPPRPNLRLRPMPLRGPPMSVR